MPQHWSVSANITIPGQLMPLIRAKLLCEHAKTPSDTASEQHLRSGSADELRGDRAFVLSCASEFSSDRNLSRALKTVTQGAEKSSRQYIRHAIPSMGARSARAGRSEAGNTVSGTV